MPENKALFHWIPAVNVARRQAKIGEAPASIQVAHRRTEENRRYGKNTIG
jgi:hypothetical protein